MTGMHLYLITCGLLTGLAFFYLLILKKEAVSICFFWLSLVALATSVAAFNGVILDPITGAMLLVFSAVNGIASKSFRHFLE